ncbi:hypothetical protein GE09DRAFT_1098402 [Coniochaeta sp. 2T2.1]|nr:hypothetical protein GE09DRAFT_1098402 [Coniochaeta sp. 2T2.1]
MDPSSTSKKGAATRIKLVSHTQKKNIPKAPSTRQTRPPGRRLVVARPPHMTNPLSSIIPPFPGPFSPHEYRRRITNVHISLWKKLPSFLADNLHVPTMALTVTENMVRSFDLLYLGTGRGDLIHVITMLFRRAMIQKDCYPVAPEFRLQWYGMLRQELYNTWVTRGTQMSALWARELGALKLEVLQSIMDFLVAARRAFCEQKTAEEVDSLAMTALADAVDAWIEVVDRKEKEAKRWEKMFGEA